MKKKILLLLVLVIPSTIAFLMEYSTVNFKKLPYYGPKTVSKVNVKDTLYYSLLNHSDTNLAQFTYLKDTVKYPIIIVDFLLSERRKDLYNAGALIDALKYRYEKMSLVEVFVNANQTEMNDVKQVFANTLINYDKIHLQSYSLPNEKQFLDNTVFFQKPYYIDYNFMVLLDKKRRVRGYYDPRYAAEIKRMYEEFKHLKIHDEAKDTRSENKLEKQ
jgi:protein SCO1